ncbi:TPA: hypothetical protein ACGROC_004083 [Klebsiella aerogenes]
MTDITRLLASLKRRSAHAKEFGHDVLFVKLGTSAITGCKRR